MATIVYQFNVAKTLTEQDLIALFDDHCRDDDWREVLRLICGQIGEQSVGKIVEHLATRTDLETWDQRMPLPEFPLAIYCLSEARNTSRLVEAGQLLMTRVLHYIREGRDFVADTGWDLASAAREIGTTWPGKDPLRDEDHLASIQGDAHWLWPHFVTAVDPNRTEVIQMVLLEHWSSEAISLRVSAIDALIEHWPNGDTRDLLHARARADDQHEVRKAAMWAVVGNWPDEDARTLLTCRCKDDPEWLTRRFALRFLAEKWPDENTRELLAQRAVEDDDAFARGAAIKSLAEKWADENTYELLVGWALDAQHSDVRRASIQALCETWEDENMRKRLVGWALNAQFSDVRSTALHAMAEKWPDENTRELFAQRAVHDSDPTIRGSVFTALGKMHSVFGGILPTRYLDGGGPYFDPLEPVPRDHIRQAAKISGIPPENLDALIAAMSAHFGWDITCGAKPSG